MFLRQEIWSLFDVQVLGVALKLLKNGKVKAMSAVLQLAASLENSPPIQFLQASQNSWHPGFISRNQSVWDMSNS